MTWGEGGFSGPPKKGDVIYEWPLVVDVDGVQKYFSAFQLSYQNKTCSECQKDKRHAKGQTDRKKTKRLFSLFIKTKVVQNVNRMSER